MRSTTYRFLVDLGAGLPLISEDPCYLPQRRSWHGSGSRCCPPAPSRWEAARTAFYAENRERSELPIRVSFHVPDRAYLDYDARCDRAQRASAYLPLHLCDKW